MSLAIPSRVAVAVLAVAVGVCAFVSPLQADPNASYRTGLQALSRKNYDLAVVSFRAAITEDPEQGRSFNVTGNYYVTYAPHLKLGVALLQLRRYAEALAALEESERRGKLAGAEAAELAKSFAAPEIKILVAERRREFQPIQPAFATGPPPRPPDAPPAVTSPPPAPQQVVARPAHVVDAMARYVDGDYRGALARLSEGDPDDPRWRTHARVFRAASNYMLYVRSNRQDRELDRAVRADVDGLLLDATFRPDDIFPPQFRRLFRRSGNAQPAMTRR